MKERTRKYTLDSQRREYQPRRRRGGAASSPDLGKPLSKAQKARLSILAREAFDLLDRHGLIAVEGSSPSARFKAWASEEKIKAVGIASLTDCRNAHYRTLRGHFLGLAGKEDQEFEDYTRTGRVKDHGAADDTHERRETFRKLIMDELLAHGRRCDPRHEDFDQDIAATVEEKGGIITGAYVVAIAKRKNQGKPLGALTAERLRQILITVRNRISAKEGRGTAATRNKSQRHTHE